MEVIETGFEGLLLLKPKIFSDERGVFYETWKDGDYQALGIKDAFLQDNISISKKNVLRGMHYQRNQGQLVTVIQGRIFDVVLDIRPTSKTYKNYFSIELDGDNPRQLYMPPGFSHGFCVLSEEAIIHYKCTQYYDPLNEGRIRWDDPEIGIKWPIKSPIISEKDVACRISKGVY